MVSLVPGLGDLESPFLCYVLLHYSEVALLSFVMILHIGRQQFCSIHTKIADTWAAHPFLKKPFCACSMPDRVLVFA
jgi:hypothetical protein